MCLHSVHMHVCLCFVDDIFHFQQFFLSVVAIQTSHVCIHTHTHTRRHPTGFLSPKALSKQARHHPLVSPPAPSTLSYSLSPTFSVSACRDLVFLFLSVRSCFYCAIFCHFGPRKGGRNAISPPLCPLL